MTTYSAKGQSVLRLFADDLTGALDSAAEFVGAFGPVRVAWGTPRAISGDVVAFDVATREGTARNAASTIRMAADLLEFTGAAIPFLKVDSLLRGHGGSELAAVIASGAFSHVVVAPAFPYQNRVTRGGRQWAQLAGSWQVVGEDLAATLQAAGHASRICPPGAALDPGLTILDAETDEDLDRIVAAGRAVENGRVLWCGAGGLAGALARAAGRNEAAEPPIARPVLGLFGTDHPVTLGQIDRAGGLGLHLADGSARSADAVRLRLASCGAVLVLLDLPRLARSEATRRIAEEAGHLLARLDRPGTLICGGGETLRAVCDALGAEALDVVGRIVPGVPRSRLVGGRWDGVEVISKSGAFGDPEFLARLVAPVAQPSEASHHSPEPEVHAS
jgi:uncharacterized protein YgbK (DUF1537 family)